MKPSGVSAVVRESPHAASHPLHLAKAGDRVRPVMNGGERHRDIEGLVGERQGRRIGGHATRSRAPPRHAAHASTTGSGRSRVRGHVRRRQAVARRAAARTLRALVTGPPRCRQSGEIPRSGPCSAIDWTLLGAAYSYVRTTTTEDSNRHGRGPPRLRRPRGTLRQGDGHLDKRTKELDRVDFDHRCANSCGSGLADQRCRPRHSQPSVHHRAQPRAVRRSVARCAASRCRWLRWCRTTERWACVASDVSVRYIGTVFLSARPRKVVGVGRLAHDQHVQIARAVYAFDAVQLDVARRRRPADPGLRAGRGPAVRSPPAPCRRSGRRAPRTGGSPAAGSAPAGPGPTPASSTIVPVSAMPSAAPVSTPSAPSRSLDRQWRIVDEHLHVGGGQPLRRQIGRVPRAVAPRAPASAAAMAAGRSASTISTVAR